MKSWTVERKVSLRLQIVNDKYIMSNQIISSVIAQVSEEKDINIVLREILAAEGSAMYIRSVSRLVDLKKESGMSFWDISLRARQLREVAIGNRLQTGKNGLQTSRQPHF